MKSSQCAHKKTTAKGRKEAQFSVGIIAPLTKENSKVLSVLASALQSVNIELKLLAIGDATGQRTATKMAEYFRSIHIYEHTLTNQTKVIKESNVVLFLKQTNEKERILIVNKKVPTIQPVNSFFTQFNAQQEKGNAFLYEKNDVWNIFAEIIKAKETAQFQYDWKLLRSNVGKLKKELSH